MGKVENKNQRLQRNQKKMKSDIQRTATVLRKVTQQNLNLAGERTGFQPTLKRNLQLQEEVQIMQEIEAECKQARSERKKMENELASYKKDTEGLKSIVQEYQPSCM